MGWAGLEKAENKEADGWMYNRNQHYPGESYPRTGEINKPGVGERKECKMKK